MKNEHRLERNRLKGVAGDAVNAVLAAAAMNFHKLLGAFWLDFLRVLLGARDQFQIILAPLGPRMPCETI